jgi:hypothetical protein
LPGTGPKGRRIELCHLEHFKIKAMESTTEHLPEYLQEVFTGLQRIQEEVKDFAMTLIMEGELRDSAKASFGEGYPYNYEEFIKVSMDPNVQALSSLLKNLEVTLDTLITF